MANKVDGLYTKLLRRVLNVSWRDHVSKHCSRVDSQPVTDLLFWTPPEGKRGRGAGIKAFPKSLLEDTALSSNQEIQGMMADRQLWRQKVNTVPSPDD